MDTLEVTIKSEKAEEEPKTIDDYFGYDIKQTLEEIEYEMDELSLEIVMEPFEINSSNVQKQIFEYKLENTDKIVDVKIEQNEEEKTVDVKIEKNDEEQIIDVKIEKNEEEQIDADQDNEKACPVKDNENISNKELVKLIERIEFRQKQYNTLFKTAMEKLKDLREQYSEKKYKFLFIKRNKRHPNSKIISDTSSESEADSSFCDDAESIKSSDCSNKRKTRSEDSDSDEPTSRSQCSIKYPIPLSTDPEILIIGPSETQVTRKQFESLQWKDAAGATRELCNVIFGEKILATHSLTGNQSPAFRGRERPIKAQLDLNKTSDITHFICAKFNVTQQLVRATITTKCADAAKKIKRNKLKKTSLKS